MISEHKLANQYTSLWRELMPMGDRYWRNQNSFLESFSPPIAGTGKKELHGVVNELAFMVFCRMHELDHQPKPDVSLRISRELANDAIKYISRFSRNDASKPKRLSPKALGEAAALAIQQYRFFSFSLAVNSPYITRPKFHGCGELSNCEGDVLTDDTLFEVKAGERTFRITDLRQLLIYSALAHASGNLTFSKIGLLNPRTGTFWVRDLNTVCRATSGLRAPDVFQALIDSISRPIPSR